MQQWLKEFAYLWKPVSERVGRREVDENNIEDIVMVNNMVVDKELGGREVTVLPSWEKMRSGVKQGKFTPSYWLRTDRVVLNTIRWGGAYLCGMGERWSVHSLDNHGGRSDKEYGEILSAFFSKEMEAVIGILQRVEWDTNGENDVQGFLSIHRLRRDPSVELTGEMSSAYGNHDTSYDAHDTSTVDVYSFEFNSLVSSYPTTDKKVRSISNRERIGVGLVHSVLLAKHLGVEKLKGIRHYYDRHCMSEGPIHRNAFNLLLQQTDSRIPDDSKLWEMIEGLDYQIPIFPYRMQMVALWDKATNWRVLQASAHQDIENSKDWEDKMPIDDEEQIPNNSLHQVNILDYCAKWTSERIAESIIQRKRHTRVKGPAGVVMETVRTFLAEWITSNALDPNWEPEIPTVSVEFNAEETP